MKIFALYIKVRLVKKPEWFDEFLEKYFEPVDLHVTLIQPRYIDEKQIDDLQSRVIKTINNISIREIDKKIFFDKLIVDKESDGKYIFMLNAKENNFLIDFQKELRATLEDCNAYLDNSNKEYEIDFKPHITIATDLDNSRKEEAEKYFVSDYKCVGLIEELVMPIVKNTSIEERTDVNNLRIFKL
ncbi:MAG: 2'-5' RNA ligase family protein [Candidatus Yanofskybacteria bacterium]|nr:2'-5' RNA ligase family protein [Candidatus Yanofskybacteria bacterium]